MREWIGIRKYFKIICNMNKGKAPVGLPMKLWQSWGRQGRRGRGRGGKFFKSLQKLFQGEILAIVIICLLRLVREQKNRVSKVAFMESIEWKQLGSHMKIFWPQITSTLISCAYLQQLLKEYQGSLGRGSRRGQPVARAKSAQQCGRRCDANRLGVSYLGLAGWIRTSRSGVLINCFLPKNISKAQYYRFMARTKDRWKILLVLGHVRIFSRIDQWRS